MEKTIIQQLYKLKAIEPDPAFLTRSRVLILTSEKSAFRWPVFLAWSTAFMVLTLAVVSSAILFNAKPALSASLNPEKINQEFDNLSINIELKEITYHQAVNQTIASALTEITDNQTKHMNSDLLKLEGQNLNPSSIINPVIDELLNQVIF